MATQLIFSAVFARSISSIFFRKGFRVAGLAFLILLMFFVSILPVNAINSDGLRGFSFKDDTEGSVLSTTTDTDGDGIDDDIEDSIGTNKTDRYGDKDKDGLYDFEEYLDVYGTPDNMNDKPKYDYNSNTTYEDILDIYHYFNLNSNKEGYLRDILGYEGEESGFSGYLLWNITFAEEYSGGNPEEDVVYAENIFQDVIFSGALSGGSYNGNVIYRDNILRSVIFSGSLAGGSAFGNLNFERNSLEDVNFRGNYTGGAGAEKDVRYLNNNLRNVTFTGEGAGASYSGTVNYMGNVFEDVTFRGSLAGGGEKGEVIYSDNIFRNVSFSGQNSGSSPLAPLTFRDNALEDVDFSGNYAGGSYNGSVVYSNNTLQSVTFSGIESGGSLGKRGFEQGGKVTYIGNNFTDVWFSGAHAGASSATTNYTDNIFYNVQYSWRLGLYWDDKSIDYYNIVSSNNTNTIVYDPHDSDDDGLGDAFEFTSGYHPVNSDSDTDGLNDSYELRILGTSVINNDTDGDGLADGWEDEYRDHPGVDPLVDTSNLLLDYDGDGLTLLEEALIGTNPMDIDTDSDELNDSYEVQILGTNPVNNDTDNDGLNDSYEVKVLGSSPISVDTDKDGLLDGHEVLHFGTNPTSNDTDGDNLYDYEEIGLRTSPINEDTDGDGLNDGYEKLTLGTDPLDNDTDGDGLNDGYEKLTLGTDPLDNDTDGDGLNDGWEDEYSGIQGIDPLRDTETQSNHDGDSLNLLEEAMAGTAPNNPDTDGDGLNDSYEVKTLETNPNNPDTDGDGLNDSYEVKTLETNPNNIDTDGDGLNDSYEVTYNGSLGVNPRIFSSDLSADYDEDGLNTLEEAIAGTNPEDNDTDGDGLGDKWEYIYRMSSGVDPLSPVLPSDLTLDKDNDSLTFSEEVDLGTDPDRNDTDGDGLDDNLERSIGTNPVDKYGDLDSDGLYDFEEYLDLYGTPDNKSDTSKYNYNDSTTFADILDIYHFFNLSSNKTGYLRDMSYTQENGGFTDYLLWNVTFNEDYAGGNETGNVIYANNLLVDTVFNKTHAGGSNSSSVVYVNNVLVRVVFSGEYAGGSFTNNVIYSNNTMIEVAFVNWFTGGSPFGNVTYQENVFVDVFFSEFYAGESYIGTATYVNNVNITTTHSVKNGEEQKIEPEEEQKLKPEEEQKLKPEEEQKSEPKEVDPIDIVDNEEDVEGPDELKIEEVEEQNKSNDLSDEIPTTGLSPLVDEAVSGALSISLFALGALFTVSSMLFFVLRRKLRG